MALKGVQLDREAFSCFICLDLLKDPVTAFCGHSYCMSCIETHWDEEEGRKIYSCPQCRQTITQRPVLQKNTMLAVLLKELKKTGVQSAPADFYAGPEDVACDVCTGRKLKALKSCLICLVSYCEQHLQPHYESPAFEKHKLVDPSKDLQENICSCNNKGISCSTECVCSAEKAERQRELEVSRQNILQRIEEIEKNVDLRHEQMEAICCSAADTVEESEKIFTELTRVIEKKRDYVKHKIRSLRKIENNRVKELQVKLEQEIAELKRKDAELQKLSQTEDHNEFLQKFPSLGKPTDISSILPLRDFEDVTESVSEVKYNILDVMFGTRWNFLKAGTEVEVLLSPQEPDIRAALMKYSCEITLDPNTANQYLILSEGNRKATFTKKIHPYPDHPDRFIHSPQVLSTESLPGRCYWEVECGEDNVVCLAVTYKDIFREECLEGCGFGSYDNCWALQRRGESYEFFYNQVPTTFSGPKSNRIGVYLDHSAGILSFYSISETTTLLVTVKTSFTQLLYAGLMIECCYGQDIASAEFCKLRS